MFENFKWYFVVFIVGAYLGSAGRGLEIEPIREELSKERHKASVLASGATRFGIIGPCSSSERIIFIDECVQGKKIDDGRTPSWIAGDGASPK